MMNATFLRFCYPGGLTAKPSDQRALLSESRWAEGQSVNGRKNKPRDIITENTARCPREYCSLAIQPSYQVNFADCPGKNCGLPRSQKEPLICAKRATYLTT